VFPVQMRRRLACDEELAAICVRSRILKAA
jgi:hypothetical protein